MKPLLSVFLDGVGYDAIKYMPFLSSLNVSPNKPMLGYSVTCHASMYTGLYPDQHGLHFIWEKSPESSPFKLIGFLHWLKVFDNKYFKYLLCRLHSKVKSYNGYFGIPRIEFLPYKYWPLLDVSEKKFWSDPGYLSPSKTIFDLAREKGIQFEIIGMDRRLKRESHFVESAKIPLEKDWVYLFLGDIDYYTHRYSKDSPFVISQLIRIDNIIRLKYLEMKDTYGECNFFAWSDHGHITIHKFIDLYELFNSFNIDLNKIFHVIEATAVRFWFENPKERMHVVNVLSSLRVGRILTKNDYLNYRINIEDSKVGELIFYLNPGYVFENTIWGNNRWQTSMHGYWPDVTGYEAFFCSNLPHVGISNSDLTDVFVTHCNLLGLQVPSNVVAHSLV